MITPSKAKILILICLSGTVLSLSLGAANVLTWELVGVLLAGIYGLAGLLFSYWHPDENQATKGQQSSADLRKDVLPMESEAIFDNGKYREMLSGVTNSMQSGDELCGIARIPMVALTEKIVRTLTARTSIAKDCFKFTSSLIHALAREVKIKYLLDVQYTERIARRFLGEGEANELLQQLETLLENYPQLEVLPLWPEQESSNFLIFHGRTNHVFEYLKDTSGNFIFATHDVGTVPTEWYFRFFHYLWDYSSRQSERLTAKDSSLGEMRFLPVTLLRKSLGNYAKSQDMK